MAEERQTSANSEGVCNAQISIGFGVFVALLVIGGAVAFLVARGM